MRNVTLLNRSDARSILAITANRLKYTDSRGYVTLPNYVAYQGDSVEPVKPATGRATCRICGRKIVKDTLDMSFYYDEEQNSWTGLAGLYTVAKEYHVHADAMDCIRD